jgi:hypothetical protein
MERPATASGAPTIVATFGAAVSAGTNAIALRHQRSRSRSPSVSSLLWSSFRW